MGKSTYRTLVISSLVIPLLGLIAEYAFGLIPQELSIPYQQYMQSGEVEVKEVVFGVASILFLALVLAGYYGMIRFRSWAPKFNVWCTVIGTVFVGFMGPALMSAATNATLFFGTTLYGAALAIAFYSPQVREMFWPDKVGA